MILRSKRKSMQWKQWRIVSAYHWFFCCPCFCWKIINWQRFIFIEFEHIPHRQKTHLFEIVAFHASGCFFNSDNITITIQHYVDINEADTGSRKHTMALCYSSLNLQILMYSKAYIDYKTFYRVFFQLKKGLRFV